MTGSFIGNAVEHGEPYFGPALTFFLAGLSVVLIWCTCSESWGFDYQYFVPSWFGLWTKKGKGWEEEAKEFMFEFDDFYKSLCIVRILMIVASSTCGLSTLAVAWLTVRSDSMRVKARIGMFNKVLVLHIGTVIICTYVMVQAGRLFHCSSTGESGCKWDVGYYGLMIFLIINGALVLPVSVCWRMALSSNADARELRDVDGGDGFNVEMAAGNWSQQFPGHWNMPTSGDSTTSNPLVSGGVSQQRRVSQLPIIQQPVSMDPHLDSMQVSQQRRVSQSPMPMASRRDSMQFARQSSWEPQSYPQERRTSQLLPVDQQVALQMTMPQAMSQPNVPAAHRNSIVDQRRISQHFQSGYETAYDTGRRGSQLPSAGPPSGYHGVHRSSVQMMPATFESPQPPRQRQTMIASQSMHQSSVPEEDVRDDTDRMRMPRPPGSQ